MRESFSYLKYVGAQILYMLHDQTITDLSLVCMDGKLATSRAVLALAYPTLALCLKGRDEETLLLLLPSFRVQEVKERIHGLLSGNLRVEEVRHFF